MLDLKILSILMVAAPLLGALLPTKSGKITCSLVAVSSMVSLYLLYGFLTGKFHGLDFDLYTWANTGNLRIPVGFYVDLLSISMAAVVSFISLMVHIYSIGYMAGDHGFSRFFRYISLFTFAMLALVMSNNFMQLFFGWEVVGLVSYLLIGFWYKKPRASFAGLKAFLINRLGDIGFIVGIAAILLSSDSLYYFEVFAKTKDIAQNQFTINLICICLFIGAMAKSAQIPLHIWLPDSMEGPTPISALIHAATMVTAGIFMIVRLQPLYDQAIYALNLITIIGSATCLLIGLLAIVESDIKRIIAYSTISQLGYMMIACGLMSYDLAMFHLVTHAFFKALLFLAAGSIILAVHHEQNIFKISGLKLSMPITFTTMLIATLALVGFPGTSGFYSKDLIIEAANSSNLYAAKFAYFCSTIGVLVTAFYSFRLLFVLFFAKGDVHARESAPIIWVPLVLLSIPSLLIGVFICRQLRPESELFVHGLISLPFALVLLGALFAWLAYIKFVNMPSKLQRYLNPIYKVLFNKYGFDWLNEKIVMPLACRLSEFSSTAIDKLLIDNLMVNDPARMLALLATRLRKVQTGYLYHYVFMMITGFFMLLIWIFVLRGV